ncbi:type I methionyl aminopeptidase [Hippea maritima]|uniref:Methionine aminopeptidase n=1 Tax=Hippea maritima (strain ATCC 700847 / DSM 10411 / MH2) TaxID=760142 RepID=F2LXS0_HIPMA|nr:type I methionyl aminopeptidase [Hippea maritima]AEA34311.1 methionine aminopeptidase, type I [Hippea maritima DSM 10411]
MIVLKSKQEIEKMYTVNQMVGDILNILKNEIKPGITTEYLNRRAEEEAKKRHAKCAFKGYGGFPKSLCTSVNEEVVHGIPSKKKVLKEGDIISLDFGLIYDGWYGDSAITVAVGNIDEKKKKLMEVTYQALYEGIAQARAGNYLYDISGAVQNYVESFGFSVVRDYVGHGIGRKLHEEPQVPNYIPSKFDRGPMLRVGMTIAIEPMVNAGTWRVKVLKDKWTVVTADGEPSAHFEHTIAITEEGPVILSEVS